MSVSLLSLFQTMQPTIQVADSEFIGYIKPISKLSEAKAFQAEIEDKHPKAAHIPYCYEINDHEYGYDEDGEPQNSTGPLILQELKNYTLKKRKHEESYGYVLVIVRYFKQRLLGVTCGRLSQCYSAIAGLTLHRFFHHDIPMIVDLTKEKLTKSYGLGAGDCEIILDILKDVHDEKIPRDCSPEQWVSLMKSELEFGGFRGNKNEELPRLQNLQADVSSGLIPCYRYPGNYRGDEWETYQWSNLSYKVKKSVEKNLEPLVEQEMNHCVTNYYRNGKDFIGHHSDKDLDLDRNGVIVSVSMGEERVLELKRRCEPQDVCRVILPHGSMLVLGPNTNKLFTHSILTKEDSRIPRISLTFRRVLSLLDTNTNRLFGPGVAIESLALLREKILKENITFMSGLATTTLIVFNLGNNRTKEHIKTGIISSGSLAISFFIYKKIRLYLCKRKEELEARKFFSRASVHGTQY